MKANLADKFASIHEYWHPYIIGALNDHYVKLAKLKGELVWHSHQHEDELFVVMRGTLIMDFGDGKTATTHAGEILIVPKATAHRPRTNGEEVWVMLIEPGTLRHTGDVIVPETVDQPNWL